jgi:hypothetical protein
LTRSVHRRGDAFPAGAPSLNETALELQVNVSRPLMYSGMRGLRRTAYRCRL